MVDKTKIILEVAHKIEDKYGAKAGMFPEQGRIIFEGIASPSEPIIPEEMNAILNQVGREFDLRTGDLAYTINNRNLVITLVDSDQAK